MHTTASRRRHVVAGQVQGVGFRPYVYRLARELGLTGFVQNAPEGVVIEVEGTPQAVVTFGRRLPRELPPLALLLDHSEQEIDPGQDTDFCIRQSAEGTGHEVLISPDVATCPDCLADMTAPDNRRYRYPFTNCTNCGPRYTITRHVPYDRHTTSMACFDLCPQCAGEYADPGDRRFHAQPNACPVCGPRVWLADKDGGQCAEGHAAIEALARNLAEGRIAAVKGLGGFHLVCDATNEAAVVALRQRKHRPSKALAIMVPDLKTASRLGHISEDATALLTGPIRPITLVPSRPDAGLARSIAPDTGEIGIMLPYTPLHIVLLEIFAASVTDERPAALVMTSGNAGGEPISLGNREALRRLSGIADIFLFHNRDILIRTDDSVVRPPAPANTQEDSPSEAMILRRARGYVPRPVTLARKGPSIVGLGPMLKATVCLTKGAQAFVSQHIGDLDDLETFGFYEETLEHLIRVLGVSPQACVADLHPDYPSTRFALEQTRWPVLRLQHHVAHIYAVLAEHRLLEPVIGLALDGTGLGEDGTLWGGECLLVDPWRLSHTRLAHFAPIRLPGGEAAVREPWRTAQACHFALGTADPTGQPWPWLPQHAAQVPLVSQMLAKGLNSPVTTSCGRLFDAVAARLGLCQAVNYEGQAAILLEQAQDMTETQAYACPLHLAVQPALLDTLALFAQVAADAAKGIPVERIARRFHLGLVQGLADLAKAMAALTGVPRIALCGGVLQNRTIAARLPHALREHGLIPLCHHHLPANDGCISLGQAAYGVLAMRGRCDGAYD